VPEQLAARAQARFEDTPEYRQMSAIYGKFAEFRAVPLGDLALAGAGSASTRAMLLGLGVACVAITLLAAINYVNLGTLRVLARQREIGIRKAFGASPARIGTMFVFESVLVAAQACLVGIAAAWLAAPILGEWVGRPLASRVLDPALVILGLVFSVVLGLAVGARPAWVAHRLSCSLALAGRGDGETPRVSWTRRALTVLQFGAATAFVAITLVTLQQANFLRQADPGFDMAHIVTIDAPIDMRDRRLLALRDEIAHLPEVRNVGLAWDVPGRGRRYATTDVGGGDGRSLQMSVFVVGPGFFESYGLAPLAGRVFSEDQDKWGERGRIVVNASAAKLMGFASATGAVGRKVVVGRGQVGREHTAEIIGVVPDIRHRSLRDPAGAVLYSIHVPLGIEVVSVQAADPIAARRAIEAVWPRHFPDDLLRIETAQRRLESLYEADANLGALIGAGGVIALCLAVFGLSALTAYTVRRRTPEIVLRKLQGARPLDIAGLLARELSLLVAAGALLGLPVAVWFQEIYLADFVVRAPAIGWSPVIAFVCTATVAALAAVRHTIRAASISPAQALRGSTT
jgi:putative ABC transport system permease protein